MFIDSVSLVVLVPGAQPDVPCHLDFTAGAFADAFQNIQYICSAGELARRLRVHQTTVSNLLNRLEASTLVRKGRSPDDQRIVHIHLTAAGRKALRVAAAPARGLLPSVLESMSAAQLRKVHDGLAVLVECMGGFDAALAAKPLPFTE